MKISKIETQKKNKNRYNVFSEGNFIFSASQEDIIRFSLNEDMEVDDEKLHEIIDFCEEAKAYDYALRLLSIKDYSEAQLKKKLKEYYYSEATINRILEKMKFYGMINDERYAEKYIHDSLNIKKVGRRKIAFDLKSKGIPDSITKEMDIDEETEFENAAFLAEKKLKSLKKDEKQKEKLYRYLISKGFDYDTANRAVSNILKDRESDDL